MVKSKKESATKVEAASVSTTKPLKKSKRDAEVDLDIQKNPKKQKKELIQAEKKVPPKKVESSSSSDSSDSSDSEEELKTKKVLAKKPLSKKDESSSEDESSDEEPVPVKKQPATLKKAKAVSSSSEDESSSSDEEPAPPKQPAVVLKAKAESSSSEDESSSDEEPAPPKKPVFGLKAKAKSSSSSEDESSSDEEPAPPKKQTALTKSAKPAAKDSSSSDEDEDSDEESEDKKKKEPATKKLPAATKSKSDSDSSEEDSDDEESDDEKPPTKKANVSSTKASEQESCSDESSEEESEDEKVTPKKKDTDVEMVEAEQKSNAKQPKTPTTRTQGGSKTLFAGNLSYQIERSDVENFFKDVGEVVDVRFALNPDGSRKGYGHVEFASAEAAQKALKLQDKSLLGRNIRLDLANERERGPRSSNANDNYESSRKGQGSQVKTVFVTNLDKSVGQYEMKDALRDHFSACGEITRISVPTDRESNATRGMAYIDLNEDGFNKALDLNGSEMGGWNITVLEARPRGQDANNNSADRFSAKPGRGPVRGNGDRFKRGPGRGNSDRFKRGPGNGNGDRRTPSKPSLLDSSQGKKIVFDD